MFPGYNNIIVSNNLHVHFIALITMHVLSIVKGKQRIRKNVYIREYYVCNSCIILRTLSRVYISSYVLFLDVLNRVLPMSVRY